MSLAENIRKIIVDSHDMTDRFVSKGNITLKEEAHNATCKLAELTFDSAQKVSVFKFDNHSSEADRFPFFKSKENEGLCAMCDYVLFYDKDDYNYIVLANLKSKQNSNNLNQLEAGLIFAQYLLNTVQRQFCKKYNPKFCKVLFSSNSETYEKFLRGGTSAKKNKQAGYLPLPCNEKHNLDDIIKKQ